MTVSRFPHLHQVLGQQDRIESLDFTPELASKLQGLRHAGDTSGFSKWLAYPESNYAPSWAEVASRDGIPVGWAGIGRTRGRNSQSILGVFVQDALRGQGVGEKLVRAVLSTYQREIFDAELDDPQILFDESGWPKLRGLIEAAGFKAQPIEDADYPLTAAVLADAPLPDLTDEEFWKRNFVRTQDRPGKRLGVELKHYLEFHRKEHPKGSQVTPDALCQLLRMTPKECGRIGLAIQYLIARKSIEKTKTPDLYRVR